MRAIRSGNACASCHVHGRTENQRPGQYGIVNRGADASGCFQIESVIQTELPLESYFPLETNLGDPFVSLWCGPKQASVAHGQVSCEDGTVPRGRLAVREGLAAADEHVLGVCRARRFLYDHLDFAGRDALKDRFVECGLAAAD
jgi:hypothetical protein